MNTKEINPIINETMYNGLRGLMKEKLLKPSKESLTYRFIVESRKYFGMDLIAWILGVSRSHLYRILETKQETSFNRIRDLIFQLLNSPDFETFKTNMKRLGVNVREDDK